MIKTKKRYRYILKRIYLKYIHLSLKNNISNNVSADERLFQNRLLLIQFDGLSDRALDNAIAKNKAPFLKKLIKSGRVNRYKTSPGVPSATATFNAGLVYGSPEQVPGYMWYDKKNDQHMFMGVLEHAERAEEKIKSLDRESLFEDGSCYCSVFGGDARKAIFTASRVAEPIKRYKGIWWQYLIRGFINIYMASKLFFVVIFQALVQIPFLIGRKIKGHSLENEWNYFYMRLLVEYVFLNTITLNAALDITEGVPVIYLDYFNYDESSHRRGPYSRPSLRNIEKIDKKIEILYEITQLVPFYNYNIYIFSDHGHTEITPYKKWENTSLRVDAISAYLNINKADIKSKDRQTLILRLSRIQQVFSYIQTLMLPLSIIFGWYLKIILANAKRLKVKDEKIFGTYNIEVIESGPYAHIYFKDIKGKANLSKIQENYRKVLDFLINNKSIGFVICREGPKRFVYRKGERFNIEKITREKLGLSYIELSDKQLRKYFKRFADLPEGGDIVALGAYSEHGNVSFVYEASGHGGIADEEIHNFILSPEYDNFDYSKVDRVEKFYKQLLKVKNLIE